jgi:hypothetical protein
MKKNFIISFALAVILLVSSCEKSGVENPTSISYGTSFGMCVDYCSRTMIIVDQKVSYTKSKHGANPDSKTCIKAISEEEIKAIKSLLQTSKINSLPEVIGCPDCLDGGAEWIEVTTNGKKHRVTFEYKNAPKELKAIADKLGTLSESFQDCN